MPGSAYSLFTAGDTPVAGLMNAARGREENGRDAALDRICRGRRRGRRRRPDQAAWRSGARPADGCPRHQPFFGRRRPANGDACVGQGAEIRPKRSPPGWARRGASAGMSCSPPTGRRRSLSTASYLAGKKPTAMSARWARIRSSPPEEQTIGGMFTKPPTLPLPFWLYYFNIDDIEAAAKRVEAGGGQILYGPTEVPGGAWIVHCTDPQGAMFALMDRRKRKADRIFRARRDRAIPPMREPPTVGNWPNRGRPIASCRPHRGRALSVGSFRFRAAAERELTDRVPRRGIRSPSSSRTDRYSRSRSHIRRAPCRSPSGRAFASIRRRPSE